MNNTTCGTTALDCIQAHLSRLFIHTPMGAMLEVFADLALDVADLKTRLAVRLQLGDISSFGLLFRHRNLQAGSSLTSQGVCSNARLDLVLLARSGRVRE